MNKLLKFLTKYWIIISISFTIVSSLIAGGWHLKGRIDKDEDILNDTKDLVNDHDNSIGQLHDDVLQLKTIEQERERNICK